MNSSPAPTGAAATAPPGAVFALAALIAPPLAVFAPLGLAPLLTLAAAALVASSWRRGLAKARPHLGLAALFLLLADWAALSALWSPIPGHSLFEAVRFLVIAAIGLIVTASAEALPEESAARVGHALLAGIALAVLLLQVEIHGHDPIARWLGGVPAGAALPLARYDRGVTVLLLLAIPAAAPLAARRRLLALAVLAIAVGVTINESGSHAARLAFVLALMAAAFASRWPRFVAAGLIAGTLFIVLAFPLVAPGGAEIARIERRVPLLQPSAIHRLAIWRFASDRITDRPILGWGMDSSRAIPGGTLPVSTYYPALDLGPTAQALPLHPHDAALEWRLELGLPGSLLALFIIGNVLWRLARQAMPRWRRALLFAYAVAAWTIAMLSFGAWQAWWLSTLWLGAALLARLGRDRRSAAG
jgi:exopolysaccharide production protein ExoQ